MNKFLIFILLIGTSEFVISASEKRVQQYHDSSRRFSLSDSEDLSKGWVLVEPEKKEEELTHALSSSTVKMSIKEINKEDSGEENVGAENSIFDHSALQYGNSESLEFDTLQKKEVVQSRSDSCIIQMPADNDDTGYQRPPEEFVHSSIAIRWGLRILEAVDGLIDIIVDELEK